MRIAPPSTNQDYGSNVMPAPTGGGGGAATTEPFVTIGNTAGLSAERALTAGTNITITDGGANSTVTISSASFSTDFLWVFGDGSSGNATFDGVSAVTGFSLSLAVYTCTATQVPMWNNVTVTGVNTKIRMANQGPFLVAGTLTMGGVGQSIDFSGNNGSGGTGGVGVSAAYYNTGTTGSGPNIAGQTATISMGGAGGAGGLLAGGGAVGGGQSGGGATVPTLIQGSIYRNLTLQALIDGCSKQATQLSGGGSGAGGGLGGGGGGGAGGMIGGVFAKTISGTGTFRAKGGNGGNATSATSGGGGGGGGGWLVVLTTTSNWASLITTDVTGGTGGTPQTTGNFGADGSAGRLTSLILA